MLTDTFRPTFTSLEPADNDFACTMENMTIFQHPQTATTVTIEAPTTTPTTTIEAPMTKEILTTDKIQEKLEKLATYDEVTLKATTVKALKSLVSGVIPYTGKNKDALIEAILDATKGIRGRQALELETENQETKRLAAEAEAKALEAYAVTKDPTEVALRQAYKTLYVPETVEEVALKLTNTLTKIDRQVGDDRANSIDTAAILFVEEQRRRYEETTIKSRISGINKLLVTNEESLQATFDVFMRKVHILTHKAALAIAIKYKREVYQNAEVKKDIVIKPLLDKAIRVLEAAASGLNPNAFDVVLALGLVCGRRNAEVLYTEAEVQLIEGDIQHLLFKGQTKARHLPDKINQFYQIRVFAEPRLVAAGFDYMANSSLRLSIPDDVNPKYSKTISRRMNDGGWRAGYQPLVAKDMRVLYAQMLVEHCPSDTYLPIYLSKNLGHSPNDVSTAATYSKFRLV